MTPRAAPMMADQRRLAIIEAVLPLLVESGSLPTTRRIAEAAGVAEGTIFRVFEDKNALLLAVAEHVVNPKDGQDLLLGSQAGVSDLRERMGQVVQRMQVSMERVSVVLMAVRGALEHTGERPTGPPDFLVRANRELLETLTAVFEPHRDELSVSPATAAVVLRSLVFGSHHPGMAAEPPLTADQIVDVVLDGVRHHEGVDGC